MHPIPHSYRGAKGQSANSHRVRSLLLSAVLLLALLALCSYPRPVAPASSSAAYQPQRLSLEVNIPAFRLDVRDSSVLVRSYQIAVGMRRYETPTGFFEIARIVWNPWWYPPDAEWAAEDTVTPPGPNNPMGKVKLMFNGPYYVHGTPTESSIGQAASHGCVRMRNSDAIELARITQRYGAAPISEALLDTLLRSWRKTRSVELPTFIPVTIVYDAAEVRDSILYLFPDIYRRFPGGLYPEAMLALGKSGVDTMTVDRARVRKLAAAAVHTAATIPLHELALTLVEGGISR